MKTLILVSTLAGFALVGSNLFAADTPASKISASQLAALGLGNMKAMSHEAALEVRGKGLGDGQFGGRGDGRYGFNHCFGHHHGHCQPCLAPCHVACGPCGGGGCYTPAVGIH